MTSFLRGGGGRRGYKLRRRTGLPFKFAMFLRVIQATSTLEDKVKYFFPEILILKMLSVDSDETGPRFSKY